MIDPETGGLIWIEEREGNGSWRPADPGKLTVDVAGPGQLAEDPAGILTNPFTVRATAASGEIEVRAGRGEETASGRVPIGVPRPEGAFQLSLPNGLAAGHEFQGFGGGVLFYDNQWEITDSDDLY